MKKISKKSNSGTAEAYIVYLEPDGITYDKPRYLASYDDGYTNNSNWIETSDIFEACHFRFNHSKDFSQSEQYLKMMKEIDELWKDSHAISPSKNWKIKKILISSSSKETIEFIE